LPLFLLLKTDITKHAALASEGELFAFGMTETWYYLLLNAITQYLKDWKLNF
jgi:hypothetical protein